MHQIIKCGKCEHILQTTILQKYEISVDLSKMKEDYIMNLAEKKIPEFFYLNDCLTYYFFQNQTIETPTDFLTNCPKCQKIPTALTKSQEIKSYPNVLCIHLNRFSRQEKENIYVDFPSEELDLNYFFDVLIFLINFKVNFQKG